MTLLCYPKCSTCRKTELFLQSRNIPYTYRDIKLDNPSAAELALWHKYSGLPLKRFFNTSGLLYKELALRDKLPALTEDEQLALLASDGMLVKRPLLICGEKVLVGFKQSEWEIEVK
ncbi:MAG: arsenate reductase family protein [Oscillospiraceae bacterium]